MPVNTSFYQNVSKWPSIAERRQQDILLQEQQAQAEQRQAAAQQTRLENQKMQEAQKAQYAITSLLQQKPDAKFEDVLKVGGTYALPLLAQFNEKQRMQLAEAQKEHERQMALFNAVGQHGLQLKALPPEQRGPAHQEFVQTLVQSGIAKPEEAQDLADEQDFSDQAIEQHLAAHGQLLEQKKREAEQLKALTEKNEKESVILKNQAEAKSAEALANQRNNPPAKEAPLPVPGRDIPFPAAVEAQRLKERESTASASEPLVAVVEDGKSVLRPRSQAAGKEPASTRERAATGQERTSLGYYNRAKDAVDTIEPLEDQIQKLSLGGQTRMEFAPNFLQSQLGQSYRQAQRQFTEARLRKESGAAIADAEYKKDAATYFAVPGDTKETLARKHKARAKVLESIKISAGRAYEEYYGEDNKPDKGKADPLGIR
jgi:hypothetical protein